MASGLGFSWFSESSLDTLYMLRSSVKALLPRAQDTLFMIL